MAAIDQTSKQLQVQKIACVNLAGFVMHFRVRRNNDKQEDAPLTDNYPVAQMRTFDLKALMEDQTTFPNFSISAKEEFWASVTAVGGNTNDCPKLLYAPNGQTATFEVRGTTLSFSVSRVG